MEFIFVNLVIFHLDNGTLHLLVLYPCQHLIFWHSDLRHYIILLVAKSLEWIGQFDW